MTVCQKKIACDELTDGRAQIGVLFLVYVHHYLGRYCFLVFIWGPVICSPLITPVRSGIFDLLFLGLSCSEETFGRM